LAHMDYTGLVGFGFLGGHRRSGLPGR
jgi:hypothetical protein